MSASLVGSEMCIRDSLILLHATFWRFLSSLSRPKRRVQPVSWHTQQAVSYTHLTLPTICSV
eukprot:5384973-Alexandrium_andersonii.AAC.1